MCTENLTQPRGLRESPTHKRYLFVVSAEMLHGGAH
jgi:hypothetical protein